MESEDSTEAVAQTTNGFCICGRTFRGTGEVRQKTGWRDAMVARIGALALILTFNPFANVYATAPIPSDNWTQQVRQLIASKQLDQAEKMIVAQMVTKPRDPALATLLAEVRFDQERFGEALSLLHDANTLGGVTALRAVLAGLVQTAAGRLDLAEPDFREAIQIDPSYAAAHYFLARLLYTQNHFDEAIQESKKAIAIAPGYVRAYENLGLCYEGKQERQVAERWYLEAIHRENEGGMRSEWPMLDLATLLIKENKPAKAKPYLLQALKINPNNPHTVYEMGVLNERLVDLPAALHEFNEAHHLDPGLASAYYRAGRIYYELGETAKAQLDFAMFKRISEEAHTRQGQTETLDK